VIVFERPVELLNKSRRHALRPGIDTESQAAEVAELLFFEDLTDIVLAGTSCGVAVLEPAASTDKQASDCVNAVIGWDAISDLAASATFSAVMPKCG